MRALWLAAALAATPQAPTEAPIPRDRGLERMRAAFAPLRIEDVRRWVERVAPAGGPASPAPASGAAVLRRDSRARLPRRESRATRPRLPVFSPAPVNTLPRGFGLTGIRPCPARGVLTADYSLVHRSPALLEVLDVGGRIHSSLPLRSPGRGRSARGSRGPNAWHPGSTGCGSARDASHVNAARGDRSVRGERAQARSLRAARGSAEASGAGGPRSSGGGSSSTRYSNSPAELRERDARGGGELRELVRIVEVVAAQADHVAARDRVARRVRCRPGGRACGRSRGSSICANGIGTKWPPCIETIARVAAVEQVLRRAVAEVARVLHVVRDRIGAAQLVADVLGDDRRLAAELLAAAPAPRLEDLADVDLGDRGCGRARRARRRSSSARSVGSIASAPRPRRSPRRRRGGRRLRRLMMAPTSVSTIVLAAASAAAELLRDQRQRRAGGLADAEREVAGLAAHRDHEVPARRGLARRP